MMTWSVAVMSPFAALAALSLAIPIIIHLWGTRKGKRVYVGNLALIKAMAPKKTRQLNLIERLLLLCRLLVLLCALLLLIQWFYHGDHRTVKNHVLVTKAYLDHIDSEEKQQLANSIALEHAKAVLLFATPGSLSPADLSLAAIIHWQGADLQPGPDKMAAHNITADDRPHNVWLEVESYTRSVAEIDRVSVYTTNQASEFSGDQISITRPINWQIKTVATPHNGIDGNAVDELSVVPIDVPMEVIVVTDNGRGDDLRYFNMAMTLLQQQRLKRLSVSYIEDYQQVKSKLNKPRYIFYFSNQPVSKALLADVEQGSTLFVDAREVVDARAAVNADQQSRWQVSLGDYLLAPVQGRLLGPASLIFSTEVDRSATAYIAATRTDVAGNARSQTAEQWLWQSDSGEKILTVEKLQQGKIIHFYSRLQPAWNNLVLQPQFPQFLLSLLLADRSSALEQQSRVIANEQIAGVFDRRQQAKPVKLEQENSEKHLAYEAELRASKVFLSLLLIMFWCLERLLSELGTREKHSDLRQLTPAEHHE